MVASLENFLNAESLCLMNQGLSNTAGMIAAKLQIILTSQLITMIFMTRCEIYGIR
jgi:hypothetical protein